MNIPQGPFIFRYVIDLNGMCMTKRKRQRWRKMSLEDRILKLQFLKRGDEVRFGKPHFQPMTRELTATLSQGESGSCLFKNWTLCKLFLVFGEDLISGHFIGHPCFS